MKSLFERAKSVLLAPKTEWAVIEGENSPHAKVFMDYLLPLALIPAVAAFVGYGLIGYTVLGHHFASVSIGVKQAVSQFITMTGGAYITAFVINLLADKFGSRKDFDRAFSLVAYAYTPAMVGGVFYILPALSWLASIASIYSLYLLYIGLQPIMKTPDDKKTSYFVISLLCLVGVFIVLGLVLAAVLIGSAHRF